MAIYCHSFHKWEKTRVIALNSMRDKAVQQ